MLDLLAGTIRTATPILLAALGGLICERVGVFNIALEGLMLFGAFFGIWGVWLVGSPWAGAGIAIVLTSILAFIFAVLVVKFHSDPTITALGINMLAEGVTTFSMKLVFGDQGSIHSSQIVGLPKIDLPLIDNIPILGDILSGYTPMVYLSWILVALCAFFLYRTSAGVNLRMVGENPRAAATAGIPVERYQILVVTISGIFCALAGTHLSMGYVTMFTENMTSGLYCRSVWKSGPCYGSGGQPCVRCSRIPELSGPAVWQHSLPHHHDDALSHYHCRLAAAAGTQKKGCGSSVIAEKEVSHCERIRSK